MPVSGNRPMTPRAPLPVWARAPKEGLADAGLAVALGGATEGDRGRPAHVGDDLLGLGDSVGAIGLVDSIRDERDAHPAADRGAISETKGCLERRAPAAGAPHAAEGAGLGLERIRVVDTVHRRVVDAKQAVVRGFLAQPREFCPL